MEFSLVSKVQEAGDELFRLFQEIIPAPDVRKARKTAKLSEAQIGQSLDRFYKEARAVRIRRGLGLISRARVIRYLERRMIGAGYEGDLVKKVVFALILYAFIGRGA